jgi:hypothetical protein
MVPTGCYLPSCPHTTFCPRSTPSFCPLLSTLLPARLSSTNGTYRLLSPFLSTHYFLPAFYPFSLPTSFYRFVLLAISCSLRSSFYFLAFFHLLFLYSTPTHLLHSSFYRLLCAHFLVLIFLNASLITYHFTTLITSLTTSNHFILLF